VTAGERTQAGREPEEAVAESIRSLADRIEALQAEVRRLGGPGLPAVEPGWADEPGTSPAVSYAWLSALETPVRRRPTVPRLLLETLFLAAAAAAAAIAKLDAPVIAGVMAGAWVLVALIEWAASRAERRRDELPPVAVPSAPPALAPADAAWFVPPVEHTLLEAPADSPTAITKLPPAQEPDAVAERSTRP
jgi:hypothetical protein